MSDIGFDPLRFFAEGGWAMFLVLGVGFLGHVLAVASLVAFVAKHRAVPLGLGAATLLFSVTTLCVGVGGYMLGMQNVEEAVRYAEPSMQAELREVGAGEADNNLYFAGCACLFPMLAGLAALARGAMMRDGPPGAS